MNLPIKGAQISLPGDQDTLKISMLNKASTGFVSSFLVGFGAKVGGLAASMAYEPHKHMVIGCNEVIWWQHLGVSRNFMKEWY